MKRSAHKPKPIPTEILARFCAVDAGRGYDLRQPFRHGMRIYASSDCIVVSIPDDGRELPLPDRVPSAKAIEAVLRTDGPYRSSWPKPTGDREPCDDCRCYGCHGTRRCECHCGNEHPCGRCRGRGYIIDARNDCRTCWGTGIVWPVQTVAGRLIAPELFALIASLGDVRYRRSGKHDDPIQFCVAEYGLFGAVMPMVGGSTDDESK